MIEQRLQIVQYPDPVLLKKAARVERMTPDMQAFIAEMGEVMHAGHGVGLAAPQVGISLRILVVDVKDRLETLINPQIIAAEGQEIDVEGCLSLPRLYGEVPRAMRVTVRGLNQRGKKITLSGDGLWARAMQHEIDHLDGIVFLERVLPETLHWMTGETDEEGQSIMRPTTLEEARQVFERQAASRI